MTLEEVLEILNDADDADVRYTISPENILTYAGLWRPSAASNCAGALAGPGLPGDRWQAQRVAASAARAARARIGQVGAVPPGPAI
jgi:hypothetical protein